MGFPLHFQLDVFISHYFLSKSWTGGKLLSFSQVTGKIVLD